MNETCPKCGAEKSHGNVWKCTSYTLALSGGFVQSLTCACNQLDQLKAALTNLCKQADSYHPEWQDSNYKTAVEEAKRLVEIK